jgi:hypothetical protein
VHDPSNTNNIFNSNNVYRKGAWVLHMLRGALGDADFFRCLSDYRAAHAFGSATTADFRRVCEQTTGRDLVGFFDQWVMSGGAPDYRYAWRNRAANGANWVYLELDQVQASQPLFEMPVRVVVTTSAGTEHHVVADDERRDQFAIRTNAPATSVAIDPDEWILRDGLNARSWEAPFFAVAPEEIDVATGGRADYHMDHGATGAGRSFVVVLGLSGSSPGTNVGGLQIPVNFDTMTWVSLGAVNTPTFINFLGNLDANGRAVSTFDLPAGVGVPVRGRTLTGAYVLVDRFDFASRPVEVSLR